MGEYAYWGDWASAMGTAEVWVPSDKCIGELCVVSEAMVSNACPSGGNSDECSCLIGVALYVDK